MARHVSATAITALISQTRDQYGSSLMSDIILRCSSFSDFFSFICPSFEPHMKLYVLRPHVLSGNNRRTTEHDLLWSCVLFCRKRGWKGPSPRVGKRRPLYDNSKLSYFSINIPLWFLIIIRTGLPHSNINSKEPSSDTKR